jgi:RNA polymerase sigma factor (TIGR02999 family)
MKSHPPRANGGPVSEFTHLLNAIESGNPQAAAQLMPLVYEALRRLAAQKLAHEPPGQTLNATALVHEAYLRLVGADGPRRFADRMHFYAAAADAMRCVLVDSARRRRSEKRGGDHKRIEWDDRIEPPARPTDDLLAIDDALTKLAVEDPESAQLVKLRFYVGLSVEDAAEAMGLTRATGYRTWNFAKAWLKTQLGEE